MTQKKAIEKLITKGIDLANSTRSLGSYRGAKRKKGDSFKILDKAFDYHYWQFEVRQFLEDCGADFASIESITALDSLLINPTQWALKVVDDDTRADAVKLYVDNIQRIISELRNYASGKLSIKPTIQISKSRGVYLDDDHVYEVRGKKRLQLIYSLRGSSIKSANLVTQLGQAETLISKEIGNMNKLVRKHLPVHDNLIINRADGYQLNRDAFNIIFKD